LYFVARDGDPAALNKHPNAIGAYSKWCGHAVLVRAATRTIPVHEMTVDVVRTDWGGRKSNKEEQPQIAF
jgi:hypothetical protein